MRSIFLSVLILRCEAPREVAAWYSEELGIPLEERGGDYTCMLGHVHFAIHGLQDGQVRTTGAELGIYISDVDEFVRRLEARKTPLAAPVRDYPWARAAQIRDPLGNLVYLMQLPKSSLQEIGRQLKKQFAD